MHGFTDKDVVKRTPRLVIWRQPLVVGMVVNGVIDDAFSEEWRGSLGQEFARGGYPRFYAMDVSTVDPQNSMGGRFRSATWIRSQLQQLEFAILLTGGVAAPSVVVRATLRVAGMKNIALFNDLALFNRALEGMRAGRAPERAMADDAFNHA